MLGYATKVWKGRRTWFLNLLPGKHLRPVCRIAMSFSDSRRRVQSSLRLILFLLMIYLFLTAIELFEHSIRMIGKDAADQLFRGLANPFAGLAVGILATALVQSSSVTTSTVVAMVGAGALPLAYAVPIVMGANIGTSITCALVALGHVTHDASFRRAFAGATVHDLFNLLTVLILFPIELLTGFLRHGATWLVDVLPLQGAGGKFTSPIKLPVKWLANQIQSLLCRVLGMVHHALGEEGPGLAIVLALVALAMIIVALIALSRNMRRLMADRIELWFNRVLRRSGLLGLCIGALITAVIQSSSITTSLMVPLFGAGVLSLEAGFPIMLGANIGTTITALLAATVAGPAGLTIAVVHLLFNLSGTLIFFPVKPMRRIPIYLAERLAEAATRNWIWIAVYVLGTFVAAPIAGIMIWKS